MTTKLVAGRHNGTHIPRVLDADENNKERVTARNRCYLDKPVPVHIPVEIEREDGCIVDGGEARAAVVPIPVGFSEIECVFDRNGGNRRYRAEEDGAGEG